MLDTTSINRFSSDVRVVFLSVSAADSFLRFSVDTLPGDVIMSCAATTMRSVATKKKSPRFAAWSSLEKIRNRRAFALLLDNPQVIT